MKLRPCASDEPSGVKPSLDPLPRHVELDPSSFARKREGSASPSDPQIPNLMPQ